MKKSLGLKAGENKVVVLKDKADERTPGGLILPDSAKDRSRGMRARVVAVGLLTFDDTQGARSLAPQVSVGDLVYVPRFGGTQFDHDGEEYVAYNHDEILAVIAPSGV